MLRRFREVENFLLHRQVFLLQNLIRSKRVFRCELNAQFAAETDNSGPLPSALDKLMTLTAQGENYIFPH